MKNPAGGGEVFHIIDTFISRILSPHEVARSHLSALPVAGRVKRHPQPHFYHLNQFIADSTAQPKEAD